jgi:hypothetical protein
MENGWAAWDLRAKEEFKFRVEKCPVILFIYIYIYKTGCGYTGY